MRYYPKYTGYSPDLCAEPFRASVPGNIQLDYINAHPEFISDINYGMQHERMKELEPFAWYYRAELDFVPETGELWFVTKGIDYIWSLLIDGEEFYSHEGSFTPVELNLTEILGEKLKNGAVFEVKIHPHPKLYDEPADRGQAAQCVKPPVSYGWDWHPRAIPSGIWEETFFETRNGKEIRSADVSYKLSDDFKKATVNVDLETGEEAEFTLFSPEGEPVFKKTAGGSFSFDIDNPKLWWCHNMGTPNCYGWKLKNSVSERRGIIGFRRIRLVMNDGAWSEPEGFPKSRSNPPAQFELNGVRLFAKGTNYVNQEIFPGTMTRERYEELIVFAKECNMNIFRCWGGSGIQKDDFYELCDLYGIMVWVEFPLACNDYYDSEHYLEVLEKEGEAIIKKLRRHPCIALWCGGNELFNDWSGMTDQYLALRLLNKLTYELSPEIPYNPTSPLSGMKHGGYTFLDRFTGEDQFQLFSKAHGTAYTEFGMPGVTDLETIKSIIPENELFPIREGGSWEAHHAFNAWGRDTWLGLGTIEKFGDATSLEGVVNTSMWLQGIGYKAIFEEARRQRPYCAMAINWCWCEPWKCAANTSLIGYPNIKKAGYFAVKDSLRDVAPSAKMPRFDYKAGGEFSCEAWLLNDRNESVTHTVSISLEICGKTFVLGSSEITAEPLKSAKGGAFTFTIPEDIPAKTRFTVHAAFENGEDNRYEMVIL